MEKDRKLEAIEKYFLMAYKAQNTYMWLSIPGGLLVGKPITEKEYGQLLYGTDNVEIEDEHQQRQLFHMKDAKLVHGDKGSLLSLVVFDGLEVAAWGIFDRSNSVLFSNQVHP